MAYHQFDLPRVRKELGLTMGESDLFAEVAEVEVSSSLSSLLGEQIPMAIDLSTEKARSELIIAPMLLEVRRRMDRTIGFFSGIKFDVDASRGLDGYCDYLLTKSPAMFILTAPVLAVVEAKNENMAAGLGQCAAEMVAVQLFNEREEEPIPAVYGVVTTGTLWRFLRLVGSKLTIDEREYSIHPVGKILGILLHCVGGAAA